MERESFSNVALLQDRRRPAAGAGYVTIDADELEGNQGIGGGIRQGIRKGFKKVIKKVRGAMENSPSPPPEPSDASEPHRPVLVELKTNYRYSPTQAIKLMKLMTAELEEQLGRPKKDIVFSMEKVDLLFDDKADPAYILTFMIPGGLPDTNINNAVDHARSHIRKVLNRPPERGVVRIVPHLQIGQILWGSSLLSSSGAQGQGPVHHSSPSSNQASGSGLKRKLSATIQSLAKPRPEANPDPFVDPEPAINPGPVFNSRPVSNPRRPFVDAGLSPGARKRRLLRRQAERAIGHDVGYLFV